MKILMVCLGNICRSPLAEGILRSKLGENFIVDSAGTGKWHIGKSPDKRSVSIAQKYGLDISSQKARQFRKEDFDEFDLIFVMDDSNYADVISLTDSEEHKSKVRLILSELNDQGNLNVPDPYYGGDDGFEIVYQLLNDATDEFITKLNQNEII